jgi:hypothetical protein
LSVLNHLFQHIREVSVMQKKVFFNKVNYNFLANVVFLKDKLQKKIQCILIYTSSKNVACKYNISGYNLIYTVFII